MTIAAIVLPRWVTWESVRLIKPLATASYSSPLTSFLTARHGRQNALLIRPPQTLLLHNGNVHRVPGIRRLSRGQRVLLRHLAHHRLPHVLRRHHRVRDTRRLPDRDIRRQAEARQRVESRVYTAGPMHAGAVRGHGDGSIPFRPRPQVLCRLEAGHELDLVHRQLERHFLDGTGHLRGCLRHA